MDEWVGVYLNQHVFMWVRICAVLYLSVIVCVVLCPKPKIFTENDMSKSLYYQNHKTESK